MLGFGPVVPGHGLSGIQILTEAADNVGVMEPARITEQAGTATGGDRMTESPALVTPARPGPAGDAAADRGFPDAPGRRWTGPSPSAAIWWPI